MKSDVDVVTGRQVVDRRSRPPLTVVDRGHAAFAQRSTGAGLVDAQGRDAATSELAWQAEPEQHFLHRVQSVAEHHQGIATGGGLAVSGHENRRVRGVFVGNFDDLGSFASVLDREREGVHGLAVRLLTRSVVAALHTFCNKVIHRCAGVAGRRGQGMPVGEVLLCVPDELIGEVAPGVEELLGADVIAVLGDIDERRTDLVDLSDLASAVHRDADRQAPHVVARKVAVHDYLPTRSATPLLMTARLNRP